MTATAEILMVRLPSSSMERLRRVSQIAQRPIEKLVADTLEASLPPGLESVPEEFREELARMETLPSPQLREVMLAHITAGEIERYDHLLERNATGSLSPDNEKELDDLRRSSDLLMFRKAYAALILKWRGEYVPVPSELPVAE